MFLLPLRLFYVCVLAANLLNVIWFTTQPITENQALHAVSLELYLSSGTPNRKG